MNIYLDRKSIICYTQIEDRYRRVFPLDLKSLESTEYEKFILENIGKLVNCIQDMIRSHKPIMNYSFII